MCLACPKGRTRRSTEPLTRREFRSSWPLKPQPAVEAAPPVRGPVSFDVRPATQHNQISEIFTPNLLTQGPASLKLIAYEKFIHPHCFLHFCVGHIHPRGIRCRRYNHQSYESSHRGEDHHHLRRGTEHHPAFQWRTRPGLQGQYFVWHAILRHSGLLP